MTGTGPVGGLEVVGRLTEASNATFLARDEKSVEWVYKPVAGEKPLWDFPTHTLGRREVAAHLVSAHYGFDVVPLTLWWDGPLGEGSVQRWIDGTITDLVEVLPPELIDETWLPVVTGVDGQDQPVVLAHRHDERLRRIFLFDLVINNTDRKVGHLIADGDSLWGVDHGVSLHEAEKHRTVLWGFRGEPLSAAETATLAAVGAGGLPVPEGLTTPEWEAMALRAQDLVAAGELPSPSGRWPAIPWPPW